MPLSYRLDPDEQIITTWGTGELRLHEVLAHFRELAAERTLPERLDVLLDLAEVTTAPSSDHLKEVVGALDLPRVHWGACAIVATRDLLYGMLRMFEVFAESKFESTRVFRDAEQARSWLRSERTRAMRGSGGGGDA